jgi:4-hydroxy-tetrahydrodipicolinate synthase
VDRHLVAHCSGGRGDPRHVAAAADRRRAGGILASAHLATSRFAQLAAAWARGDLITARDLGHALARLSAAAFAEPNPTVIKGALHALGAIPTPHVRLPLLPARPDSVTALLTRLAGLGEDGDQAAPALAGPTVGGRP